MFALVLHYFLTFWCQFGDYFEMGVCLAGPLIFFKMRTISNRHMRPHCQRVQ